MSSSINFTSPALSAPYQEVLTGGTKDWVIYTLLSSPTSNELKYVDSGSGGLEELEEEFGGGKVMWAFVRVKDPGSGLNKCVLINWLGDGVPDSKKGLFPSHSSAVAKYLKGYHVSINARNDNDVAPSLILQRVADSSGSKYSVHNEPAQPYRAPPPVTSSYVPIGRPTIVQSRPTPLPSAVGTSYVSKQNELAEIRKLQSELSSKPSVPAASRPVPAPVVRAPIAAPIIKASVPTPAPAPAAYERPDPVGTSYTPVNLGQPGKLKNRWGQPPVDDSPASFSTPTPFSTPAASNKPLTWSERQALAKSQREEEERISSAAVSKPTPTPATPARIVPAVVAVSAPVARAPPMPARIPSVTAVIPEPQPVVPEPEPEPEPVTVYEPAPVAPSPPAYIDVSGNSIGGPVKANAPIAAQSGPTPPSRPAVAADQGQKARVLYEYKKEEENEMTLEEGEILIKINQIDEGWWSATSLDGTREGLFPANYVELIDSEEVEGVEEKVEEVVESIPIAPAPPPFVSANGGEAEEEIGSNAVALYDYVADEEGELSFAEGDLISKIDFVSDSWWSGTGPSGTIGVFPANYVELKE